MLRDDIEPLLEFLEKNWPGKFSAEDVAVWSREFQQYELEEIKSACVSHKQNSRFRPYAREIKEQLQKLYPSKRSPEKQVKAKSQFMTVVAQQWAECHPSLKSEPESVVVMGYYRYLFFRAKKSIDEVTEQRKKNGKSPMPNDEMRINGNRLKCIRDCLSELLACGLTYEQSKNAAAWIDATDLEFDQVADQLRAIHRAKQSEQAA